jgi:transposase
MHENHYPSDLTEAVWDLIKDVISPPNRMGPRELEMRAVVNALLYVVDRGLTWRILPHAYPKWPKVYRYFRP